MSEEDIHAPCELKETEDDCPYMEIKSCLKCYGIEMAKLKDKGVLKPDEGIRQGHCNNGGVYGETIY